MAESDSKIIMLILKSFAREKKRFWYASVSDFLIQQSIFDTKITLGLTSVFMWHKSTYIPVILAGMARNAGDVES